MKQIFVITTLLLSASLMAHGDFSLEETESTQLVVVTAPHWNATTGHMYTFERQGGQWQETGLHGEVNLGLAGLAWGLGLHPEQAGLYKQEGDSKAPAGVFELGDAFGQYNTLNTGLHYRPQDEGDYCIDNETSPLYNKGIIIKHNPTNIPGKGCCVFIHLWRSAGKPTAGCTTMNEPLLDKLLAWLNKESKPLFVVLPEEEYKKKQPAWQLPVL